MAARAGAEECPPFEGPLQVPLSAESQSPPIRRPGSRVARGAQCRQATAAILAGGAAKRSPARAGLPPPPRPRPRPLSQVNSQAQKLGGHELQVRSTPARAGSVIGEQQRFLCTVQRLRERPAVARLAMMCSSCSAGDLLVAYLREKGWLLRAASDPANGADSDVRPTVAPGSAASAPRGGKEGAAQVGRVAESPEALVAQNAESRRSMKTRVAAF